MERNESATKTAELNVEALLDVAIPSDMKLVDCRLLVAAVAKEKYPRLSKADELAGEHGNLLQDVKRVKVEDKLRRQLHDAFASAELAPRDEDGIRMNVALADLTSHQPIFVRRADVTRFAADAWMVSIVDGPTAEEVGRITLKDACAAVARAGLSTEGLYQRLNSAALAGDLAMYAPGAKERSDFTGREFVRHLGRAKWNDLNDWFEAYEPNLNFRFECPVDANGASETPQAQVTDVLDRTDSARRYVSGVSGRRKNVLTDVIEKAITDAGNGEAFAVFLKLREAALDGTPPFTSEVTKGRLFYRDANSALKSLSQANLRARLKRREQS